MPAAAKTVSPPSIWRRILAPLLPTVDPRHLARIREQARAAAELAARDDAPEQVRRALELWALGVLSEGQVPTPDAKPDPETIAGIIRGDAAGAWGWLPAGDVPDWCGHFVAATFGGPMPQAVRRRVMPSTYRLHAYGAQHGVVKVEAPIPGDVLVVGYRGGALYGDHICLVVEVDGELIHTIEGNARGWVPGGRKGVEADARHGIIRRTRPVGPASRAVCPVSGLRQTGGYIAAYRWTGGAS